MVGFSFLDEELREILGEKGIFRKNIRKIVRFAFPEAHHIDFVGPNYFRFSLREKDDRDFFDNRLHISISVFSGLDGEKTIWRMLKGGHIYWGEEDQADDKFYGDVKEELRKGFKNVTGKPDDPPEVMNLNKLKEVIIETFPQASGFRSVWNGGALRFNLESERFQVGAYVSYDGKIAFYVNEVRNSYMLGTENEQTRWVEKKLKEKANRS